MIRADLPFRIAHGPARLLAGLLDEACLGFLAIVATALTLFPMLFPIAPGTTAAIDAAQWAIIGWFAVEYAFALAVAPSKAGFLRNPWRWIDLATIVLPLASLLPGVSRGLRSSAILRLVRLVRVVSLGLRASGVVARRRPRELAASAATGPARITLVADDPATTPPQPANWSDLERWLGARGEEWYHVSNPSVEELRTVTAAAALPAGFIETNLLGASYPHVAFGRNQAALFLWLPEIDATGHVDRHALLFVIWPDGLLSLSRRPTSSVEQKAPVALDPADDPEAPFPLRMLAATLRRVIRQNELIVARLEQDLHALEDVPVRDSRPEFFEKTFRLKKELSAAQSDLWRLKNVLADIAEKRTPLPGQTEASTEGFGRLAGSAAYLYDTVMNLREEVLSVIELHLNVVSFDMNRVMRVLAVVSVLGLVPAVIGGLFGMNLVDNPWPFTLPQVAFAIGFSMLLGLYLFFIKGWLR